MRTKVALVMLFVICVSGLMFAGKLNKFGVADQRQVTFYEQVKVGETLLPPGQYKVLHTMEGDNHVMVFQPTEGGKKAVTAKVKCTLKTLDKAADQSLIGYKNDNNQKTLNFLQFKGDTAVHQF